MSVNTPPIKYTYDDLCRLLREVHKQEVPFIRTLIQQAESLKRCLALGVEISQELINNVCSNMENYILKHEARLDCLTYYKDPVEELQNYRSHELFKHDLEVKNLIEAAHDALVMSQRFHNDLMRYSPLVYKWEMDNPNVPYGSIYGLMAKYKHSEGAMSAYLRRAHSIIDEMRVVCRGRENFKRSIERDQETGNDDDDVIIL